MEEYQITTTSHFISSHPFKRPRIPCIRLQHVFEANTFWRPTIPWAQHTLSYSQDYRPAKSSPDWPRNLIHAEVNHQAEQVSVSRQDKKFRIQLRNLESIVEELFRRRSMSEMFFRSIMIFSSIENTSERIHRDDTNSFKQRNCLLHVCILVFIFFHLSIQNERYSFCLNFMERLDLIKIGHPSRTSLRTTRSILCPLYLWRISRSDLEGENIYKLRFYLEAILSK